MISGPTNACYHCIPPTTIPVLRKRSEEGVIDRPFAWNPEVGAYEEAPQRGADAGKGHAMSFPLHL